MNLVMQFRKVCNHPDIFERKEVSSPLVFCDYHKKDSIPVFEKAYTIPF